MIRASTCSELGLDEHGGRVLHVDVIFVIIIFDDFL